MPVEIRRRDLLALTGAAALTTGAAACGDGTSRQGGGAEASAELTLPTYQPLEGLAPDLPGNEEGLHNVFLKAPEELIATTDAAPITSGEITALTQTFATPPTPMGDNGMWQRLNEALGGTLNLDIVIDSYPEKFATILASGDLPDLMWVPPNQGIPNVGPMLESQFTDLTEYLSGDAVLEYPNLAALTPGSWRTAVVNGKIWGAPIPSTPFGQVYLGNPAVWEEVDGFQCSSAEEFLDKCKEILIPGKRWALEPFLPNAFHMFGEWFGVPNQYRVNEDRTLTAAAQTDEYLETLEYAQKVFEAGAFYPDLNHAETAQDFANGSIAALVSVGPRGASEYRQLNPDLLADILVPFSAVEGRRPVYDMGYGTVGFTPFKKTDDEGKVRELLDLVNWLSAPFGTVEYMQKNYGTEGKDYEVEGGNYVQIGDAPADVPGLASALNIMTAGEGVIYNTHPEDSEYIYGKEQELLELMMRRPTNGLYSDTSSSKGTELNSRLNDVRNDVIQGRKTIDNFSAAVKEWEEGGGKKILEEFAAVLPEDVPVTPSTSL
ncbi:sugar ABC transporter substrate-binding protein [Brachybacterium saurashtrense]|uniref:Sugar ABC transporter substrate-binding protein n=1 Tax=Brachybacterium saurashtrense TaxID=556288 RepID=A0A345YST2_9MICO|nr:sugar ABC transporter substrate-binding protein [Brachybacterium saurashtrense]AXK46984.1 sugar ABC transporter substrate-binding protein [Brachybacterium saurashtrense]RRR22699.1 sugar ABC transporter substrate-binding protein [Brachybacterium saurashtrense]